MATSYKEIYDSFLSKISDYSFLNLTEEEMEEQLERYLLSSIPRFRNARTDLSKDESLKRFNNQLTDFEIEILATIMIAQYLRPQIVSSKIHKQAMTDKEFRFYSQANHLKELLELYKTMEKESEKLMRDYSFMKLGDKND